MSLVFVNHCAMFLTFIIAGFDAHFKVATVMENKLPSLNHAVASFWAEIKVSTVILPCYHNFDDFFFQIKLRKTLIMAIAIYRPRDSKTVSLLCKDLNLVAR